MYREPGWVDGFYVDNHKKYECEDCGRQFIVGEKLLEDCQPGFPVCPYCGQSNVECIVQTEDEQLQELDSDMGCLAIHVNEKLGVGGDGMKAILVIDMPECCADCGLNNDDPSGLYCVLADEYFDGNDSTEERAEWCPLIEVPEYDTESYFPDEFLDGYKSGWNACIDAITEKSKEVI